MKITVLQIIFAAIRRARFSLLIPFKRDHNPVQSVNISIADSDAAVKKIKSMALPKLDATDRMNRYPHTAMIICRIFLLRNPGGGKIACLTGSVLVCSSFLCAAVRGLSDGLSFCLSFCTPDITTELPQYSHSACSCPGSIFIFAPQ